MSYASQDTSVASRICDALRSGGIEVWFDQSELRGGDVWDQKIRRQIRDCALFIPVISAHSQARAEGYFRLEWHLADQRTHLMGRNRSFLVPICVDSTNSRDADVPDSFLAVQWTRMTSGQSPAVFLARVASLLDLHPSGLPAPTHPDAFSPSEGRAKRTSIAVGRTKPAWRWVALLLGVAALAAVAVGYLASHREPPPRASQSVLTTPAPGGIAEKSVAVLPFTDMSEKKDQEYFSDGLAEQMIDLLSQMSNLRVPARTSSFYFKGKSETVASIAEQLKVANVLEGSVRKAGKRLRITVQLIRADSGYHLWSQTYDREDSDIFAVQDDVAKAVVAALQGTLDAVVMPTASRGTSNSEAYYQYLRGRQLYRLGNGADDFRRAVKAYEQAIALDRNYGVAYAGLALAEGFVADNTGESGWLDKAYAHAERAVMLAPQDARVYASRGYMRLNFQWDWTGAQADLERALRLDPRDRDVQHNYAELLDTLGHISEAIAAQKTATELDPMSTLSYANLGYYLLETGDYAAAEAALNRAVDLAPTNMTPLNDFGMLRLLQGRSKEAVEFFVKMEPDAYTRPIGLSMAEFSLGHSKESQAYLDESVAKYAHISAYQIATIYAWRGEKDQAFKWLNRAYEQHDGGLAGLKGEPMFKLIRQDPRFDALITKLRLPP